MALSDEMRRLPVPGLQDEGPLPLGGRQAMELGRECLKHWATRGWTRSFGKGEDKSAAADHQNRRTGHWLNHGKELAYWVGEKGHNQLNRGLDCDVIVAEVRATSHKPDEIYGIITERLLTRHQED